MFNAFSVPGISVKEVAEKREQGEDFILLDVREPLELQRATLGDWVAPAPLSKLSEYGFTALPEAVQNDKEAEIIVMCHHGVRSAQVAAWLRQNGWTNVYNMEGGIDAYAIVVDPSVGKY